MPTQPMTGLAALLEELRELPHGLNTPVNAALLVADVLRALDWPEPAIAAAVGVDLVALEGAPVALV